MISTINLQKIAQVYINPLNRTPRSSSLQLIVTFQKKKDTKVTNVWKQAIFQHNMVMYLDSGIQKYFSVIQHAFSINGHFYFFIYKEVKKKDEKK